MENELYESKEKQRQRVALIAMSDDEADVSQKIAESLRLQGMFVWQIYDEKAANSCLHNNQEIGLLILGEEYEHIADNVYARQRNPMLTMAVSRNGVKADRKFSTGYELATYIKDKTLSDMYCDSNFPIRMIGSKNETELEQISAF